MKSFKSYIEEDLFATPMNTIGMGDMAMPASTNDIGSGDIPQPMILTNKIHRRKKRFKRYKIV